MPGTPRRISVSDMTDDVAKTGYFGFFLTRAHGPPLASPDTTLKRKPDKRGAPLGTVVPGVTTGETPCSPSVQATSELPTDPTFDGPGQYMSGYADCSIAAGFY